MIFTENQFPSFLEAQKSNCFIHLYIRDNEIEIFPEFDTTQTRNHETIALAETLNRNCVSTSNPEIEHTEKNLDTSDSLKKPKDQLEIKKDEIF